MVNWFLLIYLSLYKKIKRFTYIKELQKERGEERQREREILIAGLLSKWPQWPGLGQAGARGFIWSPEWAQGS